MHSQRNFVLNIGFGRSPTSIFEVGFEKSDSKIARWYRLALLAAVANSKILRRKITARFKLNLKADGLDCKMFFKFGGCIERLHSARKQGRRIYNVCICKQCVCLYKHHLHCKTLVGNTQTRELHPLDAGCILTQLKRNRQSLCKNTSLVIWLVLQKCSTLKMCCEKSVLFLPCKSPHQQRRPGVRG